MDRYLAEAIKNDALASRKMALVSGPRQVGKTTLAKTLLASPDNYFSYDHVPFRRKWLRDPAEAVTPRGGGPIVLDEIHKDRKWKSRLKGLYDREGDTLPIIVTGSARLDIYRRGGDSLLGRYLPYRLHPLTVGESRHAPSPADVLAPRRPHRPFADLLRLGGFPEPFLAASESHAKRWSRLRLERLLYEDVRDLRAVGDLAALRSLAELLPERAAQTLSLNAIREDLGIAYGTAKAWLEVLESLYVVFLLRPYAKKIARALRAEPKLYLFDILQVRDAGARRENLTALHLLKAAQYWTDTAAAELELRYVRDKEKREVDFLLLRDGQPWMLIECKSNDLTPSPSLLHYSEILKPEHTIQLVDRAGYDRVFAKPKLRIVSYDRFLSGFP